MHTADYLICYDIADERRLAKLARYLEKLAIDDVRIYRIKLPAVTMGDAIDLSDPLLLV